MSDVSSDLCLYAMIQVCIQLAPPDRPFVRTAQLYDIWILLGSTEYDITHTYYHKYNTE